MRHFLYKACTVTGLLVLLTLLPGCDKFYDYVDHHHGPATKYDIKRIRFVAPYTTWTDTVEFTYNSAGNPVSGLRPETGTGFPNYFFQYDKSQRMVALISAYGETPTSRGVECWNKYFYDGAGRIVKDSAFFFPYIVNGQPVKSPLGAISVYEYQYDSKNRIIKVTWWPDGIPEPMITTYAYDSRGNRTDGVYDDKVNFRQTNKIWMFLDQDYSVNNQIIGTFTYNKHGLPTKIQCYEGGAGRFCGVPSGGIYFTNASIDYTH